MLGWEFPPVFSGGLGVVSKKLAHELAKIDIDVCLAIPEFVRRRVENHDIPPELSLADLSQYRDHLSIHPIKTTISSPYISAEKYTEDYHFYRSKVNLGESHEKVVYGENLFQEIERYTQHLEQFSDGKHFDLIHAHDWITFAAGVRLKEKLKIPLILHVHATEMDRTGGNPNPDIFGREQHGLYHADLIVAVSELTKNILIEKYDIPSDKIIVVHNALRTYAKNYELQREYHTEPKDEYTVLFIGRVTLQKGPDYFLEVAQKVLKKNENINFIIAGDGDMLPSLLKKITKNRLQKNIHCVGFLNAAEKRKAYEQSDICIIPSVSEPFGLTVLEAVEYGIPVILSKTAGAQEVVSNALKSDFWDAQKMAEYVLALAKYPVLHKFIACKAYHETRNLSWVGQAKKIKSLYEHITSLH
jgi:glycosyltransferase involved in cell wall biosynthesis